MEIRVSEKSAGFDEPIQMQNASFDEPIQMQSASFDLCSVFLKTI